MELDEQEQQRRQAILNFARRSTELEGGQTDAQARAIQDRWARGEIDGEEMTALTRELCGLPRQSA